MTKKVLTPTDFQVGDIVWIAPIQLIEEVRSMAKMNDKFYSHCRIIAGKKFKVRNTGEGGVNIDTEGICGTNWTITKNHLTFGILCKEDPNRPKVTLDEGLFKL